MIEAFPTLLMFKGVRRDNMAFCGHGKPYPYN